MAVPYHTHTFEIPTATKQDMAARAATDKAVTPSVLGTAATADISQFATAEQGRKADSAVQPQSLKNLAYKDKITVNEINTNGAPSNATFLSGNGWQNLTGGGDMTVAIYDPQNKRTDAFDMANMKEADNAKVMTADERKLLTNFKNQVLDQMVDGSVIMCPFAKPAYRMIIANGAILNRKDYPLLWGVVAQLGAVSEADWQNGNWGAYSTGDGSTTFRIPNLSGEFPRFLDTVGSVDKSRKAGSWQGDAIRNINGYIGLHAGNSNGVSATNCGGLSGVFNAMSKYDNWQAGSMGATGAGSLNDITIDASRVVPTAGENRPRNIALLPCIRY